MTHEPTTTNSAQLFAALATVLAAANAAPDSRSLAQAALERALEVTSMTSGSIWLAEEPLPTCLACFPTPPGGPQLEEAASCVLADGHPQWRSQGAPKGWVEATLPLVANGTLIGILVVAGAPEPSRALIESIAAVVAGALQQARLAERVEVQRRELQAINRQHDKLIAIISHDLKNPMASIKGYADLLLRRSARTPDDPNRHGLQIISEQIVRMTKLLDTLLEVSRIASQRVRISRRPANLAQIVAQLVEELRETSGGAELRFEGADAACPGTFDVQRIRQAIEHVVQNAIAFSPQHRPVEIRLHCDGQLAVLTIRDYGIGLPDAERERIFDPFFRASNAADRAGMGVGLFIAREILAWHGGQIRCESAEGPGSIFSITLPLDPE